MSAYQRVETKTQLIEAVRAMMAKLDTSKTPKSWDSRRRAIYRFERITGIWWFLYKPRPEGFIPNNSAAIFVITAKPFMFEVGLRGWRSFILAYDKQLRSA